MAEAIEIVRIGLQALFEAGVDPADSRDAITCITELEQLHRLGDGATVKLMDAVDSDALFVEDGHASPKVMIRHHAKLSNGEAAARLQIMKTCRLLPDIETAYTQGDISTCHMRVLGRVQSNPRIRHHMADCQDWFLNHSSKAFDDFDGLCRGWVARLDEDGPTPRAECRWGQAWLCDTMALRTKSCRRARPVPGHFHWDHNTYQETLNRIDGLPSQPINIDNFRCETTNGVAVDPTEAAGGRAFSCDSIARTTKS